MTGSRFVVRCDDCEETRHSLTYREALVFLTTHDELHAQVHGVPA